jgi:CubicO group peptidase (beta-lactamase class C family)
MHEDGTTASRRDMLRYSAAAGVALMGMPLKAAIAPAPWPNLDAMASDYVASGRVANMLAAVGRGDPKPTVFAHGYDTFGGPRVTDADSLYRIYSMTKPITGMAAMMLVDEGLLGLDQPVAEILPKFANMQVQKTYDGPITPDNLEPAKSPITIRQLMTHTAGIGYSTVQQGPIAQEMRRRGIISGRSTKLDLPAFNRGKPVATLAEFADGLADFPLVAQPGTKWIYSTGLDLLGRVIEVASGQSFDSFLTDYIFDLAGMSSTYFLVPPSELGRMTTNYGLVDDTPIPIDPGATTIYADPAFPMGGSGLVSSPRDYDRFLNMLAGYGKIEGRRVMGELAVRVGTSNILEDLSPLEGTSVAGYGYGAGGRIGWGGMKNAYGWAGAANTVGFVDMDSGLRVGLFTQLQGAPQGQLTGQLDEALAKDRAVRQL